MTKVTLNDVGSLIDATTAATTINGNNATIETASDNTLSRDGTAPNQMLAELDMNGKQILNLPNPATASSALRLADLTSFVGGGTVTNLPSGGTTGQALKKNSGTNYDVGWANDVSSVGLSLPADFTVTGSPVTSSGTLTGAWVTTPTGTGAVVRKTSPTLTTPDIGSATAATINKMVITAPATASTLTIANNKTFQVDNTMTLQGTDSAVYTMPPGTTSVVGLDSTQTISNKTLTTPTINGANLIGTTACNQLVSSAQILTSQTGASAGIGYTTGAGGTVTQATSKSTGFTLNRASGAITMNNAALAADTVVSFVFTSSCFAATDVMVLNHISGGTINAYHLNAQCAAGSATINVRNISAGSLSEAIVIQFALIKGVNT